MNIFKRAVSFLCAAALFAGGMLSLEMPAYTDRAYAAFSDFYDYQYDSRYAEAEKHIAEGLYRMDKKINLSSYKLTNEQVIDIFTDVLMSRPDIFYVKPQIMTYYSEVTNTVLSFEPVYYYSKSEVKNLRTKMDKAANEIISGVKSSWSDLKKALYVHDRIIKDTVYDETDEVRTAYEALVNKKGVCVAYALAYKYVLNKLEISCVTVSSDEMNHSWNMVEIDGSWYHADLTWDDPVPDFYGQVDHDYFLLSDSAVKNAQNKHYGWEGKYKCSSDKYDNYFWENCESSIIPVSSRYWYYIDSEKSQLCRYDWETKKSKTMYEIDKKWKYSGALNWDYCFSRLESSGRYLYFNTGSSVLRFDTKTKNTSIVKKAKLSGNNGIYGLLIRNGRLVYQVSEYEKDPQIKTYVALELSDK